MTRVTRDPVKFCPKPTTVSELKVALEKILDSLPQVQLTELFRVPERGCELYLK